MGNIMSEEQEAEFLEEGFDLDSPDADKVINYGTAEPNCQPKHTQTEDSKPSAPAPIEIQHPVEQGTEVAMDDANMNDLTDPLSPKHRRDSNVSNASELDAHASKRQHVVSQKEQQQREKKMSYIQMAKLGYQELVNAIIRPPRADYKVCSVTMDSSHVGAILYEWSTVQSIRVGLSIVMVHIRGDEMLSAVYRKGLPKECIAHYVYSSPFYL